MNSGFEMPSFVKCYSKKDNNNFVQSFLFKISTGNEKKT